MADTTQPTTQPLAGAVDVNVHLSQWPCRRLPLDEPAALMRKLRELGVASAWCGSFDALLHRDIAAVNARLFDTCNDPATGGMLVPFGAINPMLPDWEEDLRRCHETFRMPGVRLYPNYHGYKIDGPQFARVLQLATDRKLIVQIAVTMEDERVQHPLMRAAPVDVAPLPSLIQTIPAARVVLLNALSAPRGPVISSLRKTPHVAFDIGTLESVGGVASLLEQVDADRVLYGSHAPFLYLEAATLKMKESALSEDVARKVISGNAVRLLKGT